MHHNIPNRSYAGPFNLFSLIHYSLSYGGYALTLVHIGLDDIDSPFGGCTTDLAADLVIKWFRRGLKFIDFPNLIRFVPTVPWKTRGNGGVAIRLSVKDEEQGWDLCSEAVSQAIEYTEVYRHPESHPAVACLLGEVPSDLKWLGLKAVRDIVPPGIVEKIIGKYSEKLRVYRIAGGQRGIVGAVAAIGNLLEGDYTYELIAYRSPDYIGRERLVDPGSVIEMDKVMKGETFLNVDYEIGKPLITPHGPDPVLLGIRGESPAALVKAFSMLRILEPVSKWIIYRTNQATDQHLRRIKSLGEAYPYTGVIVRARVYSGPRRIMGGHVIFKVTDGEHVMDAAAYEPTGRFRDIVGKLVQGDLVEIYGVIRPPSSRHGPTINIEKIKLLELAKVYRYEAPRCPRCGKRMKSMGRGKGYKCPKCRFRDPTARKIAIEVKRNIRPGFYQPPPRAFKHLMKPIERFGREKNGRRDREIVAKLLNDLKWVYPS